MSVCQKNDLATHFYIQIQIAKTAQIEIKSRWRDLKKFLNKTSHFKKFGESAKFCETEYNLGEIQANF